MTIDLSQLGVDLSQWLAFMDEQIDTGAMRASVEKTCLETTFSDKDAVIQELISLSDVFRSQGLTDESEAQTLVSRKINEVLTADTSGIDVSSAKVADLSHAVLPQSTSLQIKTQECKKVSNEEKNKRRAELIKQMSDASNQQILLFAEMGKLWGSDDEMATEKMSALAAKIDELAQCIEKCDAECDKL